MAANWPLFSDPPQHTRLRQLMTAILNPQFLKETKQIIETEVKKQINSLLSHTKTDFMSSFAMSFPIRVINTLLGTQLEIETVTSWSLAISMALDHGTPEDFIQITPTILSMQQYFAQMLSIREKNLKDDWISKLIKMKIAFALNQEEIISSLIFLLLAGHETLKLSIGLGVMLLLQHPSQLKLLQNDANYIPHAIEETLRFGSPVRKLSRWTRESVQFEDITIPADQIVVGLIKEANFDEERFNQPHDFDVTRSNNRHLTFSCGIHQCTGASLARYELQTALKHLLPYLDRFTLLENEIGFLPNSSFNYLYKLPISILKS